MLRKHKWRCRGLVSLRSRFDSGTEHHFITSKMITLTEKAEQQVFRFLNKRGGLGIRVGIKTTGCSGLAYVLEYVDNLPKDDEQVSFKMFPQYKVFVDQKSKVYLNGLQIDYTREGLNEGFKFVNPNEKDKCGCGESFRV